MKRIVITGASSGLGLELVKHFLTCNTRTSILALHDGGNCRALNDIFEGVIEYSGDSRLNIAPINLCQTAHSIKHELREVAGEVFGEHGIDVLINCAGVNHIDWIENLPEEKVIELFQVNVYSILYTTQALLGRLQKDEGTIVNVVSNAYRMPMTHSWIYNGTKGAAAIITRQMARELNKTHGVCVFGICPNKLEGTRMSQYIEAKVCDIRGWTPSEAAEYQKGALVAGFETKPEWIAEHLVWLLSLPHRHKYLSGCLLEMGY